MSAAPVNRCAGAADARIRLIAARALVAVLQPSCLPRVARHILLIVSPYFTTRQPPHLQTNFVHGILLHVGSSSRLLLLRFTMHLLIVVYSKR